MKLTAIEAKTLSATTKSSISCEGHILVDEYTLKGTYTPRDCTGFSFFYSLEEPSSMLSSAGTYFSCGGIVGSDHCQFLWWLPRLICRCFVV